MKRIISLFAVVAICAGLFSCASSPGRGQNGSSVWKVSGNGNTLFLGGSVHVLRAMDYPLPKEFDQAFSHSTMLVLETDIEQAATESVQGYLMTQMILPGNQTLRSVLDSDTYELLRAKYSEYGLSVDEISKLKPSMAVLFLTILQIEMHGFVQQGVDTYYLEKAKDEGKPIGFLETVQAQIDLMVTMGDGYENDYVRYSLQDMENTETGLEELLAEWRTGGSSDMDASLAEMKEQWPLLYASLLTDRNAAWMPQIEACLASGEVAFVIVGLAHLHGPDGLLRQLEDSGYTVEQFIQRR